MTVNASLIQVRPNDVKGATRIIFSSKKNTSILALKYSESKSIFRKANHLAEKLNKILMFVLVILTPACGALPWIIYTYSMYFTTDLGPNAFQIPIPMW